MNPVLFRLFVKALFAAIGFMACFHPCIRAQVRIDASARPQAMGGITSVLTGAWSALQNQAGLATVDRISFALHAENYFMVPGWGTEAFAACLPVSKGTLGLAYAFYGTGTYNEMTTKLVFGRSFGEQFRAGIELDYLRIRQPAGYPDFHALVPGAGIQVLPTKGLMIALHVFNPAVQHFSNCPCMKIPVIIRVGAAFTLGEEVLISSELLKVQHAKTQYATGLEYSPGEKLQIRIGILFGELTQPTFGMGFQAGLLQVDLSSRYHPIAGFSPAASLVFSGK